MNEIDIIDIIFIIDIIERKQRRNTMTNVSGKWKEFLYELWTFNGNNTLVQRKKERAKNNVFLFFKKEKLWIFQKMWKGNNTKNY